MLKTQQAKPQKTPVSSASCCGTLGLLLPAPHTLGGPPTCQVERDVCGPHVQREGGGQQGDDGDAVPRQHVVPGACATSMRACIRCASCPWFARYSNASYHPHCLTAIPGCHSPLLFKQLVVSTHALQAARFDVSDKVSLSTPNHVPWRTVCKAHQAIRGELPG